MSKSAKQRDLPTRQLRQLKSNDRVGRYARNLVWTGVISFIRRTWYIHLFILLVPSSLISLILLQDAGTARWVAVGMVLASSFWIDVIFVILWSGVASTIMGIEAESLTSQVLREFASKDWTLINGFQFKGKGDIDHILIGPAGVLIFETKWSSQQWPMELRAWGYQAEQIARALKQVIRNRDELRVQFKAVMEDVPTYAVCVLWSADESREQDAYFYRETVYGIRGSKLADWLSNLPKTEVIDGKKKMISESVASFARKREIEDLQDGNRHRLTLNGVALNFFVTPILGFIAPALILTVVALLKSDLWVYLSTPLLVAGIMFIKFKLKRVALSYSLLAGLFSVGLYVLVYLLSH